MNESVRLVVGSNLYQYLGSVLVVDLLTHPPYYWIHGVMLRSALRVYTLPDDRVWRKFLISQQKIRSDMIDTVDRTLICKVCDFSSDSKTEIHRYLYINRHLDLFQGWYLSVFFYDFAKCKLSCKSVSTMNVSTTGIMGLLKNCHQGK